jgi:hypothetical protein
MSSTDLERAWLHYEITRAQMALGPMLMAARNSAKKCLLYGKSAGSKPWRLLANTMLMRVEAKSKKRKDARNATQDAEDLARDMQEKEIENFIGNVSSNSIQIYFFLLSCIGKCKVVPTLN